MNSWNCSDAGRVGEQRGEKAREQVSHCRGRPWGPCLTGASEPEPEKCSGNQPSLLLSAAFCSPLPNPGLVSQSTLRAEGFSWCLGEAMEFTEAQGREEAVPLY